MSIAFGLFLFVCDISAQDDPIRVDADVVRLNVGVADRQGRPILNLQKYNFTVYEDGVKQDIAFFEPTVAPFSVVMMLDMSGSTTSFRQNISMAASRFIASLGPEDRVAVIEFYDKVNLLNEFTADKKKALYSVSVANGKGTTNLYKGLKFALDKLEKEGPQRRKAIVVLTDGVDTQLQDKDRAALSSISEENKLTAIKPENAEVLNQVLNNADRQGVTIFPLALPTGDPKRLADPTPAQIAMYEAARSRLQIMADRTGGRLNAINRLEDLGRFYAQVAADLRALYTVVYQSSNEKSRKGQWRAIKLDISEPELIVRTRPGYFVK
ncbi:MAG TPA: VWA domain-containing protein [Pyrinomonadaceae bacterium]|nr:VWA domain-containing protein [Pyrinomonadaceae bacterium]